jgi:hypothetical protein
METTIKLTPKTASDFGTCIDIYNAEVSRGEYAPDLFDLVGNNLVIKNTDGAILVLEFITGEIEHCHEVMDTPWEYQEAYRVKKRLQKVIVAVCDAFPDWETHPDKQFDYRAEAD